MSLSRDQERFISEYLRDVALKIDPSVEESRAQRGIDMLEKRIRRAIASRTKGEAADSDVVRVLDDMGPPEEQADLLRPGGEARRAARELRGKEVWLGVLSYWAGRFEIPVLYLRIAAIAIGLTVYLAPLAVLVYIGAFAHLWWTTPKEERPLIDWVRMVWNVATCIVILVVLGRLAEGALWLIDYAYAQVMDESLPPVGSEWGWIKYEASGYYSLALWCAFPLAVLSGLPLVRGWEYSIKRLYLAILTIYGVMLSYGIACFVVGLLFVLVDDYDGLEPLKMLEDYLPDGFLTR